MFIRYPQHWFAHYSKNKKKAELKGIFTGKGGVLKCEGCAKAENTPKLNVNISALPHHSGRSLPQPLASAASELSNPALGTVTQEGGREWGRYRDEREREGGIACKSVTGLDRVRQRQWQKWRGVLCKSVRERGREREQEGERVSERGGGGLLILDLDEREQVWYQHPSVLSVAPLPFPPQMNVTGSDRLVQPPSALLPQPYSSLCLLAP